MSLEELDSMTLQELIQYSFTLVPNPELEAEFARLSAELNQSPEPQSSNA